jgi:AcrR family transcriptional regulator
LTCQVPSGKIFTKTVYVVHDQGAISLDGFEKRREEKKKAILQAAFSLFDLHGYDKVTMADIAAKAHASKVSIYKFFESKDNLRRTLFKNLFDEAIAKKKSFNEEALPFTEKISGFIGLQTEYYGTHSLPFFFEAVESDPVIGALFDEYTALTRKLVLQFIDAGRKEGVIPQNISSEAIEIYIDIFQSYFFNKNKTVRDAVQRNPKLAEELNMLFLDGLIQGKHELA